jgi:hypothetical protein
VRRNLPPENKNADASNSQEGTQSLWDEVNHKDESVSKIPTAAVSARKVPYRANEFTAGRPTLTDKDTPASPKADVADRREVRARRGFCVSRSQVCFHTLS